ncbi:antibiotic biosynthesis monooxygenase family protein [Amycolatopsis sp. NPDC054798]
MFTFINRYQVTGDSLEFEKSIDSMHEYMATRSGYLSHRLYRSAREPGTYVEIAEWDLPASHRSATSDPRFRDRLGEILKVATAEPGPFEQVFPRA